MQTIPALYTSASAARRARRSTPYLKCQPTAAASPGLPGAQDEALNELLPFGEYVLPERVATSSCHRICAPAAQTILTLSCLCAGRGAERAAAVRGVRATGAHRGQRAAVRDGPGRLGAGAAAAAPSRCERAGRRQQQAGSQAPSSPPLPPHCARLQLIRSALSRHTLRCISHAGTDDLAVIWH